LKMAMQIHYWNSSNKTTCFSAMKNKVYYITNKQLTASMV